jgi:hypothetical protein
MQEFESISASSYDPSALAAKLTAKAAEGWSVVAIVPTGGDVTAFLSRGDRRAAPTSTTEAAQAPSPDPVVVETASPAVSSTPEPEPEPEPQPEPVSEPSGWAIAPEPATPTPEPTSSQPEVSVSTYQPAATPSYEPAIVAPAVVAPAPEPAAAPAVPAGWYADPAGRFELRYWDGSTWTEHVSRAGQQFTDPPVA